MIDIVRKIYSVRALVCAADGAVLASELDVGMFVGPAWEQQQATMVALPSRG